MQLLYSFFSPENHICIACSVFVKLVNELKKCSVYDMKVVP